MKKAIIILQLILTTSCTETIQVEKIGEEYFGDYSYSIDTIGETDEYILKSYEIYVWAAHTEYFKGFIKKSNKKTIYKLKIHDDLQPRIINDSLALVNSDFYVTKDKDCWIEKYTFDSYKLIYSLENDKVKPYINQTEKLKKGVYFLENGKLNKVEKMNKIGLYFLTKHSRGIEKLMSFDELIKQ
jgi:hypothetical protein